MNATHIRPAVAADLPALLALYAQYDPNRAPPPADRAAEVWRQTLDNPLITVFLADSGGTPAATCMLVVTPCLTNAARPFAVIENVITDAACRRQGHGRAVLDAAIAAAWRAGCYKVMLATGSKRPETLRFYENAGFTRGKTAFQIRAP